MAFRCHKQTWDALKRHEDSGALVADVVNYRLSCGASVLQQALSGGCDRKSVSLPHKRSICQGDVHIAPRLWHCIRAHIAPRGSFGMVSGVVARRICRIQVTAMCVVCCTLYTTVRCVLHSKLMPFVMEPMLLGDVRTSCITHSAKPRHGLRVDAG